jgi:hypothetical protein
VIATVGDPAGAARLTPGVGICAKPWDRARGAALAEQGIPR